MLVYLLQEDLIITNQLKENRNIKFLQNIKRLDLQHNDSLSLQLSGIPLSNLEIECYNVHYSIWTDFLNSNEEHCLIIENIEDYITNKDQLEIASNEIDEVEIVLPFNPFKDKQFHFDITYTYGRRMGLQAYYIKKSTAVILVKSKIIELPVDEYFLYLSEKEMLSISMVENELLFLKDNSIFLEDRNENKLRTILSINNWSQNEKTKVIEMLKYIFIIATHLDIPLFLSYGTLLGFVRHNEIMGWDDDIDISTENKYIQLLISKIESDGIYQIKDYVWNQDIIYYKVWCKDGDEIAGYDYTFPFIDIWLYSSNNETIDFGSGIQVPYDTVFPLKDELFHQISVKIPKKSQFYLDKLYTNWRTMIQIYSWNHKKEKPSNFPLEAIIQTSSKGKFLKN